jgi:hypothetical protein
MLHGSGQRDREVLQKARIRFRDRRSETESRHPRILAQNNLFKFGTTQQISLFDGNLVLKYLKPFRRTDKCGDAMTLFPSPPDDLQSGATVAPSTTSFMMRSSLPIEGPVKKPFRDRRPKMAIAGFIMLLAGLLSPPKTHAPVQTDITT